MLSTSFIKLLLPLAAVGTVLAQQGPPVDVQICRDSTTISTDTAEAIVAGTNAGFAPSLNQTLGSAPWIPDCISGAPDTASGNACIFCQEAATLSWGTATALCQGEAGLCLFGALACDLACSAAATYTYYSALKACYCANIDCSAVGVSNSDPVSRRANFGGAIYAARMGDGFAPSINEWIIQDPTQAVTECTYEGTGLLEGTTPAYGFK